MSKLVGQGALEGLRSEGGLLPPDILQRIAQNDPDLPGLTAEDYHLVGTETLAEAITGSWNHLVGLWQGLQEALRQLGEGDHATGVTRERFLLPLLQELGYGRLPKAGAGTFQVEDRSYPISHLYQHSPIHLLGAGVPLDRRTEGVSGAATASPHGLLQHFLNSSDAHLWGIVSNGRVLRILRDHYSLTQQAYVEFDLESIFDGELFHAFRLLWLVCHQSRVEADKADECWLERWFETAREEGVRALDHLREGVEGAIESFGRGFLRHASNSNLKSDLASGILSAQDYYRELLRLVYRLIFLFVAEDRESLLDPAATDEARARYLRFYATKRIRELSRRRRGTIHGDLWQGLLVSMGLLKEGSPSLGLPALGSFLWSSECLPHLNGCKLSNDSLLQAIRRLSTFRDGRQLYPVNWRNVGSEELGSVYESLLELSPELSSDAATFELLTKPGHERKTSGSYYTPSSLVSCLLNSALNPVLDEAGQAADPETALLGLKVCDPASGSGHFLVAAARRIAHRLATVRSGDEEPSPEALRHALRDVVGRCIYGVDVNPMAVELCKVSLWMEALEPGKPLSFLDHHIRCGNSLLGATPALLEQGIPNDAFKSIEGDDRKIASSLRKQNRVERKGQVSLFADLASDSTAGLSKLSGKAAELDALPDDSPADVRHKELRWRRLAESEEAEHQRLRADTWCAAFVWPKHKGAPEAPTHELFLRLQQDPQTLPQATLGEVLRLSEEYALFHWHLAFPSVFAAATDYRALQGTTGWAGGFDVVLSNPPWDEIQFEETAWFASRDAEVADAPTASERKRRIERLSSTNPTLYADYRRAVRHVDGMKAIVRQSGLYPGGARGKLNTYVLFTETNVRVISPRGRAGSLIPTGIATDDATSHLFESLMSSGRIHSLYDFINERRLFPAVRPHQHFCLLTVGPTRGPDDPANMAAFLRDASELGRLDRLYELSWNDIVSLSPEKRSLPLFPTARHAVVFRKVSERFEAFGSQAESDTWEASYQQGTFNTASDSGYFRTKEQLQQLGYRTSVCSAVSDERGEDYIPLFDAKMARQYSWRAASLGLSGHQFRKISKSTTPDEFLNDPHFVPTPAYWVPKEEAISRLRDGQRPWLLGFKDVTGPTSTRMAAFAVIPCWGVADKYPLVRVVGSALGYGVVLAWMNSVLVEFVLRQRMQGVSLTWHLLCQLPAPSPADAMLPCPWDQSVQLRHWLAPRVAELSVTATPVMGFARDLGVSSGPFHFKSKRRHEIRCEIDAAWCLLAGLDLGEVEFILDYLEKVRSADERKYGEYRTKRIILEIYCAMTEAVRSGQTYQTVLDPPPADPSLAHVERDGKATVTH